MTAPLSIQRRGTDPSRAAGRLDAARSSTSAEVRRLAALELKRWKVEAGTTLFRSVIGFMNGTLLGNAMRRDMVAVKRNVCPCRCLCREKGENRVARKSRFLNPELNIWILPGAASLSLTVSKSIEGLCT